jgi:hypothetical protein
MRRFIKGTAFAAVVILALVAGGNVWAQMGGHDSSMPKENPVPFVRDMNKAAEDILDRVKTGRVMDARSSLSVLTSAADKVLPHITDTVLKDKLRTRVDGIKTLINSGNPDLFDLEDAITLLQESIKEAMGKLQSMK